MSYIRYYIFLAICIGLQFFSTLYAQEQYHLYKHIDNFDNSSCIRDLCIDKNKTLWIATESGAYKLDGIKLKRINLGKDSYTGRSTRVYPDINDNIYIQAIFGVWYIVNNREFNTEYSQPVDYTKNYIVITDSFKRICNKKSNNDIISSIIDSSILDIITEYRHEERSVIFDNKRILYIDPTKKNPITTVDTQYFFYEYSAAVLNSRIYIKRDDNIDEYINGVLANNYSLGPNNKILKFYPQYNSSYFFFSDIKGNLYKASIKNDSFTYVRIFTSIDIIEPYTRNIIEIDDNIILSSLINGLYILKKEKYTQLTTTKHYSCNYLHLLDDSSSVLTSNKSYIYNQNKLIDSFSKPKGLDNFFLSSVHPHGGMLRLIYHTRNKEIQYSCITVDVDNISSKKYHLDRRKRGRSYFYAHPINDKIWISTGNYFKGYYINNEFNVVKESFHGYPGEMFHYVYPLDDSNLAICSSRGLLTYNIDSNTYTRIPFFFSKEIRYIYKLNDSVKLIFTYGNGIYVWKNRDEYFKLPLDKNKLLTNCHYTFEDKRGRLWLPTNSGIIITNKTNIINYVNNRQSNIPYYTIPATFKNKRIEFNGGSPSPYTKDKNGVYYLSNTIGLLSIKPDNIECILPQDTPQVYLLNDDNIPTQDINNMSFAKDTKHLSLFISNSTFWGYPENLKQEYCLCPEKGDHKHLWLPIDDDRNIELLNIPNGCYNLCIRQLSSIDNNPYTYAKIPFSIELYWYQKTWIKLLLSLLCLTAILAYIIIKQRKLKTRNLVLSKEVARVTANLRVKNSELQHTLDNRDKLVAFISHDMAGSLHFLNKTMNQISNISDDGYRKQVLAELCNASEELENYTNDIIIWLQTQINNAELTVSYTTFNLQKLLQDISHPIFSSKNNNNTIKISALSNVDITSDKQILGIIVHNILSNANKFTDNGEINIDAIKGIGKTKIIFSDTGKGFPNSILKGEKHKSAEGHGLGLIIIKDLISTLKGEVKFTNNIGAVVTIIIPTAKPV